MKQILKVFFRIVAIANILAILLLLFVGFAGKINPATHPTISNLNALFPIVLIVNLGFLLFWIIFKFRKVWLPLLGLILCYQPVRTYFPLNVPHELPDSCVKVVSYNVAMFGGLNGKLDPNPIVDYLLDQNADIICLQEGGDNYEGRVGYRMKDAYPYHDTAGIRCNEDVLVLYSRYPIIHKERIPYPSAGNHSSAFTIDMDGEEVIIIGNHFETTDIGNEDKANFKRIVKGELKGDSAKLETHTLFEKLKLSSTIRGPQADAVAQYIRKHAYQSILCMGDFNDGPLSYSHQTIAKELNDCYRMAGNGAGFSFNYDKILVRIDHFFCSDDWQPIRCKVDRKMKLSDHYPVICYLKKRSSK